MKIWRYNACFCCLNCLPGCRQFASLPLMFSLWIFKSMQNTAHSPATNRRLLPDLTRHELATGEGVFYYSGINSESARSLIQEALWLDMLINSKYIHTALLKVFNSIHPVTLCSWIIPAELKAWVGAELCDLESRNFFYNTMISVS